MTISVNMQQIISSSRNMK